jgi:hypothetical protein
MESVFANPDEFFATTGVPIALLIATLALFTAFTILVIKAVIYCMIFRKAGYHWALGLLMLVPIACIIMPFVLAFGRWPIQRQLDQLRAQQRSAAGGAAE